MSSIQHHSLAPGNVRGRTGGTDPGSKPPDHRRSSYAIVYRRILAAGLVLGLGLGVAVAGCAGGASSVPTPGTSFGGVPNLQGQSVMVLPVQIRQGVPESSVDMDSELRFALEERGASVRWLFPDTLRTITSRNPGIEAPLEGLPVGVFLQGRVERIGDPLYGHLRRLGVLASSPVAVIPVRLRYRPTPETVGDQVFDPAMELTAALIHLQSGRVLWFGIVDGATGGPADQRSLASAADRLARILVP
ncbi:MAG: hypothetical protein ACOC8K_02780 [Gemmatimonadota bacterium]